MAKSGLDTLAVASLPQWHDITETQQQSLISRYREFRLNALRSDPEAFASSYIEEVDQPPEYWVDRLSNPTATHLVVLNRDSLVSDVPENLAVHEWSGMVVVLGPLNRDPAKPLAANESPWTKVPSHTFNQSSASDRSDKDTNADVLVYHLSGTYVVPAGRGRGAGKLLMSSALATARMDGREAGASKVRVGVHVDTVNVEATRFYEKAGFKIVSEDTYPPRPNEQGQREEKQAYLMQTEL